MKIVSIVGPTQCGSTLLFNLTRFLYEANQVSMDSCWVDDYANGQYDAHADVLVVKVHSMDINVLQKADIILLPLRDLRDAALSHMMRFKDADWMNSILENINIFSEWEMYATYIFYYETYQQNKLNIIEELCTVLSLPYSDELACDVLQKVHDLWRDERVPVLDNMQNNFYRKTLLSQHRNTANGASRKYLQGFSDEQNLQIVHHPRIYSFLLKHGYETL
jgi:hypothetical protein